jgi:hypothetical protein
MGAQAELHLPPLEEEAVGALVKLEKLVAREALARQAHSLELLFFTQVAAVADMEIRATVQVLLVEPVVVE